MKKIAIFHWGVMSVHSYYLALQLARHFHVDLFLYTPAYNNEHGILYKLVHDLRQKVNVIEFKPEQKDLFAIRASRLGTIIGRPLNNFCINPFLPQRTRKLFFPGNYEHLITITQPSLFWLYQTDKHSLGKTIHYSLEVEKMSDPGISAGSCKGALIKQEQKLLPNIRALLIQDRDRAVALCNGTLHSNLSFVLLPVSVPGETIITRSVYLHEKLQLPASKKIILYYGAIYQERKIDELAKAAEKFNSDEYVLVLHGAGEFSKLSKGRNKVKTSNEMVPFEELYKLCSSATIGIAFYDQSWPNTQLTAFSSEKIARYLQCGVPFIAFKNDNYQGLQSAFKCCELIEKFEELEHAVEKIMADYERYRSAAFAAYEKYFRIENSIRPLIDFLKSI